MRLAYRDSAELQHVLLQETSVSIPTEKVRYDWRDEGGAFLRSLGVHMKGFLNETAHVLPVPKEQSASLLILFFGFFQGRLLGIFRYLVNNLILTFGLFFHFFFRFFEPLSQHVFPPAGIHFFAGIDT